MGMGRIPGNLPIELVADYMNDTLGAHYDIDELMDAIQTTSPPSRARPSGATTPAYFLSARYNLHRNYAEHYLAKGDLTNRDINHILSGIEPGKKTAFDKAYADRLYREYQSRRVDDAAALEGLIAAFAGRRVLVLAPGATLADPDTRARVAALRGADADAVVSANFVPEFLTPDYAFFTNAKRHAALDCQQPAPPGAARAELRGGLRPGGRDLCPGRQQRGDAAAAAGTVRRKGGAAGRRRRLHGRPARLRRRQPARPHRARAGFPRRHGRGHPQLRAAGDLCDPQRLRTGLNTCSREFGAC